MKSINKNLRLLIKNGRIIDPASGLNQVGDVRIADGQLLSIADSGLNATADFSPDEVIDASGCIVMPGIVDLAARLGESGQEPGRLLPSELRAAVAGGITSLVCPPDTTPVLDEPGLVQMLCQSAEKMQLARVFPLGALTRQLEGKALSELQALATSGCIGFGQAEVPVADTLVLLRAMQYAATFGFTLWLRPQDFYLGRGVAASGAVATRLGLAGIPVAAETVALHTLIDLARTSGVRLHVCRISSAAGLELVKNAKAEGLPISCDISINSLWLLDADIGYFDSRMRLQPPLRQQRDRDALAAGLFDGSIDALVSDHSPVARDAKALPFAEAEPGAGGLELLLGMACKWAWSGGETDVSSPRLIRALAALTSGPAAVLGQAVASTRGQHPLGLGQLVQGSAADVCIFDPAVTGQVQPEQWHSQARHTPFQSHAMPGRVRWTLVQGQVAYAASNDVDF